MSLLYFPSQQSAGGGGGGKILQVLQSTKTDIQSISGSSRADITDLSQAITPASADNKILISVTIGAVGSATSGGQVFYLMRDTTDIGIGTESGYTLQASFFNYAPNNTYSGQDAHTLCFSWLDSPSTTSATTYKIQWSGDSATTYINRRASSTHYSAASVITLMEVDGS